MAQPQTYLDLDTSMAKPPPNPLPNQTWSKNSFLLPLNFRPNEDEKGWTKFSLFFSLTHGNGGEQPHIFFHHIPFHYFMPMLLILFFSTHDAPTQHVYDMSCPSHLVYHACHGRPLLIRGGIWHASPPFLFHALIGPYASTYHISKMSHISPID